MSDPLRIIGREILRTREALGLSQAEVAIQAKLRCGNLTYIEAGSSEGSFLKIARVCRVLGISIDDLIEEIDG